MTVQGGKVLTDNREGVINVIGHINPDTDSVCSAIAYAYLKRKVTGKAYIPKRAGQINAETDFVLKYFGVPAPDYMGDVRTQVIDIDVERVTGVDQEISLKKAWTLMKNDTLQTLPVVDSSQHLLGLITIEDIAKSYMDVYDSRIIATAGTPFHNVVETLDGEMLHGEMEEKIVSGKCLIAAANPDLMESYIEKDDIVILGNRYESQLCAIEMGAKCIIVCDGSLVSYTISKLAESKGCYIIKTPYDTFTASRLINQSIPISFFMKSDHIVSFGLGDYLEDIRGTMVKKRYRDFPILDWNGKYYGMISRRSLMGARKKKLILVDHNERSQAVDGIEDAEILEIIDHHRIGNLETMSPVFFRNQPLGCTATIIYQMFLEAEVALPKDIAGLLCSAILSDTLIYRSPTCTDTDRTTAEQLAIIAGISTEKYATEMFAAGSNLSAKSPEEIFYQDFKKFVVGDLVFGVGQITAMDHKELDAIKDKLLPYMEKALADHGVNMIFFMLTDILQGNTRLLYNGNGARELAIKAFHLPADTEAIMLQDVVSRKKQIIPAMIIAAQE
ncbi:MAG: putative manganese-dependent inorganic diphosphatase [Lachnospiraceae bacterium]|nr:putative manganese-dependent inorganic diphosphatase [Lachnospiraceae bacterium]